MEQIVKRRKGLRASILAVLVAMIGLTTVVAYVFWAGTIGDANEVSEGNLVTIGQAGDVETVVTIDGTDPSTGLLIPTGITRRVAYNEVWYIDFDFDVEWLPYDDTMAGALYEVEGTLFVSVPRFNVNPILDPEYVAGSGTPFRDVPGRIWTGTDFDENPDLRLFNMFVLDGDGEELLIPIVPTNEDGLEIGDITAMADPTQVTIRVRMNQPMDQATYQVVRNQIAAMQVRFAVLAPDA